MRERRAGLLADVQAGVRERRRIRGGWAFRFPPEARWLETLAGLTAVERECCRFLRFRLTAEPDGGPLWLEVTGPRGTARFVEHELGLAA
ncbi:MAG TPA: hypothetical protein VF541_01380 [Longimicrobium sp.]